MSVFLTLDEIEAQAPAKGTCAFAYWSSVCCWWATDPADLGNMPGTEDSDLGPLPCCPHCRGVLLYGPLRTYLDAARSKPERFGPFGLDALAKAHAANSRGCARSWTIYSMAISIEKEVGGVLQLGGTWNIEVALLGSDRMVISEREG